MSQACNRVRGFLIFLCSIIPSLLSSQPQLRIASECDDLARPQAKIITQNVLPRPKIALVLSGGGARGVAQIGVLRAFERSQIPIDFICGTSFGAIIGGLYASGYTIAELESLAIHTNWDEILSLSDEISRRQLFFDQKLADDRSFLVVRFQGLTPVIPPAVSTGQRLTDFISDLTLQALYHPQSGFDDLRIPFRCVATDLISGRRVVISEGSLWEALRATSTVPLLFSPVEKDSMELVDGGLVSNVPVDVARSAGCDIVVAVNSTSGLRAADEMQAPWQTADQIMGIMMQLPNQEQLKNADVVITPQVGRHLASDFKGLDSLIAEGERSAEQSVGQIRALLSKKWAEAAARDLLMIRNPTIAVHSGGIPDSLLRMLKTLSSPPVVSATTISQNLHALSELGTLSAMSADVIQDSVSPQVIYSWSDNPVLRSVRCEGCNVVDARELEEQFADQIGQRMDCHRLREASEAMLRLYRAKGYSLARIDSSMFDHSTGTLRIVMNEGIIRSIEVEGGVRTRDEFVLQDFPLVKGDVFQVDRARTGVARISGTTLFEYVYLDVSNGRGEARLIIRLRERPSQLVRFGFRGDNERGAQGSINIRDENFRGSGMELGLTLFGGGRNQDGLLEYSARRLFSTTLSFNVGAMYSASNDYLYGDALQTRENHWDRVQVGEYRIVRYGGMLTFGNQLERLGSATAEYLLQDVRVKDLSNAASLEEHFRLALLRFGAGVDTKDSYPFPTSGIFMNMYYEVSLEALGSQVSYNALRLMYESYSTWGGAHTFHPRFTLGFADRTMPMAQQFRIGGRETFFGLREDDRFGRQLLLVNIEYRYHLPFRLVFDTYLRGRFDAVTISSVPAELKFSTLRYGAGAEVALSTPLGPANIGIGKSFYFGKNLPENPLQEGPFVFYFMIGYQL